MITHTHHFSFHHSLPDVAHYEADNVVVVSAVLGSRRHLIISFSTILCLCVRGLQLNGKYAVHPGESINISSPKKVFHSQRF